MKQKSFVEQWLASHQKVGQKVETVTYRLPKALLECYDDWTKYFRTADYVKYVISELYQQDAPPGVVITPELTTAKVFVDREFDNPVIELGLLFTGSGEVVLDHLNNDWPDVPMQRVRTPRRT